MSRAAIDFDAFYDQDTVVPEQQESGDLLVLSVDGKGVVMRESDWRSSTQKAAQKRKPWLSSKLSKGVDKCADELLKYKAFLHYDKYLAQGFSICSGVIEGTCRHLINDRMDRTGARWGLKGAEAVLKLPSLYASGDLEDYWTFHEQQEQQRNHTSRYADKKLPPLQTPNDGATGSRHLHLVK